MHLDFKTASEKFKLSANTIESKLAYVGKIIGPIDPRLSFNPNYQTFFKGFYHFVEGLSKLAMAHHLSSNENSVEAERLCNEARSDMSDARNDFIGSGVPGAGQTFGETCNLIAGQFISSYVTYYQKQTIRKEEITKMKKEITKMEQERDELLQASFRSA